MFNNKYHHNKPVEEDDDNEENEKSTQEAPGYAFDGFTIELNEKVSLTPVVASSSK